MPGLFSRLIEKGPRRLARVLDPIGSRKNPLGLWYPGAWVADPKHDDERGAQAGPSKAVDDPRPSPVSPGEVDLAVAAVETPCRHRQSDSRRGASEP